MRPLLLVEDDDGVRNAVAEILGLESLPVEIATNGIDALRIIRDHAPSLVILDMNLPGMSGVAVGIAIKERWDDHVPILAMTADGRAAEKCAECHADLCITKPFSIGPFLECVYRLIKGPTWKDSGKSSLPGPNLNA